MISRIRQIVLNPLFLGSAVIFVGGNVANVFHFLYNLYMSRNLSVENYGVLASLISLLSLPGYLTIALAPVVVKFAGEYFAHKDFSRAAALYFSLMRPLLIIGGVACICLLLLSQAVMGFFHITDFSLYLATVIVIFFTGLFQLNNMYMQAKLNFGYMTVTNIISGFVKFLFGVIFVIMGWQVFGAITAILLSVIFAFLFSLYPLKELFKKHKKSIDISYREVLAFGIPSAVTLISFSMFITVDIWLTKHFFSPTDAGLYAGLSLMGRIIFFLSAPIGVVMFPLMVNKHSKNENFTHIFLLSMGVVSLLCLTFTTAYYLFPDYSISFFLKKQEYLALREYIGPFSIVTLIYSLISLIINFYLTLKRTNIYRLVLLGAVIQAVLLWNYHESITQVFLITGAVLFVLLISLLLYYPYVARQKVQHKSPVSNTPNV